MSAQLMTPENSQNSHLRQDMSKSACRHGAVSLGCKEFTKLTLSAGHVDQAAAPSPARSSIFQE